MMKHTVLTNNKNDLLAGETLTELIDNNRFILENRISKDTIKNLIYMLIV